MQIAQKRCLVAGLAISVIISVVVYVYNFSQMLGGKIPVDFEIPGQPVRQISEPNKGPFPVRKYFEPHYMLDYAPISFKSYSSWNRKYPNRDFSGGIVNISDRGMIVVHEEDPGCFLSLFHLADPVTGGVSFKIDGEVLEYGYMDILAGGNGSLLLTRPLAGRTTDPKRQSNFHVGGHLHIPLCWHDSFELSLIRDPEVAENTVKCIANEKTGKCPASDYYAVILNILPPGSKPQRPWEITESDIDEILRLVTPVSKPLQDKPDVASQRLQLLNTSLEEMSGVVDNDNPELELNILGGGIIEDLLLEISKPNKWCAFQLEWSFDGETTIQTELCTLLNFDGGRAVKYQSVHIGVVDEKTAHFSFPLPFYGQAKLRFLAETSREAVSLTVLCTFCQECTSKSELFRMGHLHFVETKRMRDQFGETDPERFVDLGHLRGTGRLVAHTLWMREKLPVINEEDYVFYVDGLKSNYMHTTGVEDIYMSGHVWSWEHNDDFNEDTNPNATWAVNKTPWKCVSSNPFFGARSVFNIRRPLFRHLCSDPGNPYWCDVITYRNFISDPVPFWSELRMIMPAFAEGPKEDWSMNSTWLWYGHKNVLSRQCGAVRRQTGVRHSVTWSGYHELPGFLGGLETVLVKSYGPLSTHFAEFTCFCEPFDGLSLRRKFLTSAIQSAAVHLTISTVQANHTHTPIFHSPVTHWFSPERNDQNPLFQDQHLWQVEFIGTKLLHFEFKFVVAESWNVIEYELVYRLVPT